MSWFVLLESIPAAMHAGSKRQLTKKVSKGTITWNFQKHGFPLSRNITRGELYKSELQQNVLPKQWG